MQKEKTENKNIKDQASYSKPVAAVATNVAIIFGLPAFLVAFLSQKYNWSGERTALLMVTAFFISWAIMILRFKTLTKNFEQIAKEKTSMTKTEEKLSDNNLTK